MNILVSGAAGLVGIAFITRHSQGHCAPSTESLKVVGKWWHGCGLREGQGRLPREV